MPVRRARWLKPRSVSILLPLLTFAVLTAATRWPAGGRAAASEIRFASHTIDTGLTGGYQVVVSDLDRDGRPDLIALADGLSEVRWYRNPGWERHVVVSGVVWPVNLAAADLDGDGIPELALTDRFDTKYDSSAGVVSILTHRGDPAEPWVAREIDRLPTSHRLRFADIDGSGSKVLIDAPLIGPGATQPEYRGRVPIAL